MTYKSRITAVYTILHFFVDFTTVFLVTGVLMGPRVGIADWGTVIILYNIVAFAGQLPIGIVADILKKNHLIAGVGCILAAVAYPVTFVSPWIACVLAALGNGAFHIGGGVDILRMSMPKSGLSGLFVSSGAMGVWLAYKLNGLLSLWVCPLIMTVGTAVIMIMCRGEKPEDKTQSTSFKKPETAVTVATTGFVLTIVIRSLMGMVMNFPWKAVPILSFMAVLAVVLGKALGGFIADRFGGMKTVIVSLGIALIAFFFAKDYWMVGFIAIVCFNMTMPLTLTAIAKMSGGKYGFSFGLTTFALAIGFIPTVFGASRWFGVPFLTVCTALSLLLMVISFLTMNRKRG